MTTQASRLHGLPEKARTRRVANRSRRRVHRGKGGWEPCYEVAVGVGASMTPTIQSGGLVVYDPRDTRPRAGEIMIFGSVAHRVLWVDPIGGVWQCGDNENARPKRVSRRTIVGRVVAVAEGGRWMEESAWRVRAGDARVRFAGLIARTGFAQLASACDRQTAAVRRWLRPILARTLASTNGIAFVRGLRRHTGLSGLCIIEASQPSSCPRQIAVRATVLRRPVASALGSTMWRSLGLPGWWLGAVWVHPWLRGSGLGARVTTAVETASAKAGHRELMLNVAANNTAARNLYTKLGYRPFRNEKWRRAIEAHFRKVGAPARQVLMRKSLSKSGRRRRA